MHHIKTIKQKGESISLMKLKRIVWLRLNIHPDHFKASLIKTHTNPTSLTTQIKQTRSSHHQNTSFHADTPDTPDSGWSHPALSPFHAPPRKADSNASTTRPPQRHLEPG